MRKPILTIFYPFDPWHSNTNRIEATICSFIKSFIKNAPNNFEIRLVGTGKEKSQIGVWEQTKFAGRNLEFMPLITLPSDQPLDTTAIATKYTASLIGCNLASDFMHFHRLEPSLSAYRWVGDKTLFIYDNIQPEISPRSSKAGNTKNSILWQTFPDAYFELEKSIIDQFDQTYLCHEETLSFYQQRYPQIADRFIYLKNSVDAEIFQDINSSQKALVGQQLAKKINLSLQKKDISQAYAAKNIVQKVYEDMWQRWLQRQSKDIGNH